MVKGFKQVGDVEKRLVLNMKKEGVSYMKILKITGRSPDTVTKILYPDKKTKKHTQKGAPRKISQKEFGKILKSLRTLQCQKHPQGKEVTADMVLAHAGVWACARTLLREFRRRQIRFFRLKERPILTKDDIKDRKAWALKRKGRSRQAWVRTPHAIIDNKRWPIYGTAVGRAHAARRSVRGAYQLKGQQPESHLVKPKGGNIKFPAPGVMVSAAVINGKIRMWEYIRGPWNGDAAVAMYKGPLVKAMRKAFPAHAKKARAKWLVLEDNDPTGYKCSKAKRAKSDAGIITDDLPRRSPDFNVLDYSLWHAINLTMREQECSWPEGRTETKAEYMTRLRKTAMALPTALVKKCVGDMHKRCRQCLSAKPPGGLFNEGGR